MLAKIGKLTYFPPGTGYHYSNTDFVLLGLVVEKATGQTVAALVRTDFLTPLGLTHTYLQTEEKVQGPRPTATAREPACVRQEHRGASRRATTPPGRCCRSPPRRPRSGFAGAYVSTASDLAVWANALYGGDVLDQADTGLDGGHLADDGLQGQADVSVRLRASRRRRSPATWPGAIAATWTASGRPWSTCRPTASRSWS